MQSLDESDFVKARNEVSEVVANLDTLSRKLISKLEYFVVLAPSVASRGAKAKANYVFANADLYRIAEIRKISGYPAVSDKIIKQLIIIFNLLLILIFCI